MALTQQQMVNLNQLLATYPSSANHPTLLAEMFVALAASSPTAAAEWRAQTLAAIQAAQAAVDAPYSVAQTTINNS